MAKTAGITYQEIVRAVDAGSFHPIYYLMGEESYYIDLLSDYIVEKALAPEERDFNLVVLYGSQVEVEDVILAAKRYPMMAERQVVVVREVQQMKNIDRLVEYAKQPLLSTVLILCHKNGKIDRRTKFASEVQKVGVLFESNLLYENELGGFVSNYVRRYGCEITPEANSILCDSVGANLSRIAAELDKLLLLKRQGIVRIDAELIEKHVGISKEYNNFEFIAALSLKDVAKANKIVKYFDSNPKNFALQPLLALMLKYYSDLMQAYYAPDKTEAGVAAWLGQNVWQVKRNIMSALRAYNAMQVFNIIAAIRQTDAASKGVGPQKGSDGELLKELVFFILH